MGLGVRRQHREETVSRRGLAVPEQDGAYNFSAASQGEPMAVEEPTVMGETHKGWGGVGSTTPKSPNPRTFFSLQHQKPCLRLPRLRPPLR